MLTELIHERMNISDATLIGCLKAIALAVENDQTICDQVLEFDGALNELFAYLNYPHKGIKIQVSSILSTLRKFCGPKCELVHPSKGQIYHSILIELMN
jgi:hypothetical protein